MRIICSAAVLLALATGSVPLASAHAAAAPAKQEELVEFDMMTWPEVKAALAAGKTTALFYTGGTEQRGPQNIIAGHNLIGRAVVKRIAQRLGNALAMPVLQYSPGNADPALPGDIGITTDLLGALLERLAEQAIATGFKNVVLMGDSGGGQGPNGVYASVAKKLDAKHGPQGIHVYYADHPYTAARDAFNKYLADNGYPVGQHGGIQDTSEMMYLEDGSWVRKDQLANALGDPVVNGKVQVGPNSPRNGITGDARRSSVELGRIRHEMKVDYAVKQIQGFIAGQK